MTITLHRDAGHPWTGAPGWDQLGLACASQDQLTTTILNAQVKFWRIWVQHSSQAEAVMYKPSGATASWLDDSRQGTPKPICRAIAVGDIVDTDYSHRITRHRVTARTERHISQTGIMLRVTPTVAGATFIGDDGSPQGNPWIDSAWFRPAL